MADTDRERWNRRYADRLEQRDYAFEPSRWLLEIADQLRPPRADARALDLACGGGRNAVWLAERRWTVDAWDLSDVGLAILSREIDERAARGAPVEVYPQQIDLDTATIPEGVYDLVLNILFLDRRLWPQLAASLRPGGLLVFQTFVDAPGGRTSEVSPEHLLQSGEPRAAFEALGLETLSYDEAGERSSARLLARKP
ncbi:MAG: methyltransferase domain-containing protein [Chloroflexi bacterium]|nr:methyltransferase domain-containing protein [Chloroflexota bacterium]